MIVEFFGVPGAGKSTLYRALLQTLPNAHTTAILSKREVAKGVSQFILFHPVSFCVWMYFLVTNSRGLFRYKLGLLLRSMAARSQAEKHGKHQLVVLDEGLLQRLLTVFEKSLTHKQVTRLLRLTPLPALVVVVTGGDFGRFTTDPGHKESPRTKRGEAYLRGWVDATARNAETVARVLPSYVTVLNRKRGEARGSNLVQEVERLLKSMV